MRNTQACASGLRRRARNRGAGRGGGQRVNSKPRPCGPLTAPGTARLGRAGEALPTSRGGCEHLQPTGHLRTKRTAPVRGGPMSIGSRITARSALGELEAPAALRRPNFLRSTTRLSRVRNPAALSAPRRERLVQLQRLRDAVLDRTGLTREATALDGRHRRRIRPRHRPP